MRLSYHAEDRSRDMEYHRSSCVGTGLPYIPWSLRVWDGPATHYATTEREVLLCSLFHWPVSLPVRWGLEAYLIVTISGAKGNRTLPSDDWLLKPIDQTEMGRRDMHYPASRVRVADDLRQAFRGVHQDRLARAMM